MNYAPEFVGPAHHTISVFGVFKDGRMDTEAWYPVAAQAWNLFGQSVCTPAYDADLVMKNAALTSAVDEYTRSYGVTDPLLNEFATAAKGDLILVLSIAGKPLSLSTEGRHLTDAPLPMNRDPGGHRSEPVGSHPVEVSASLFSVPLRRSVASIAERYAGKNTDLAIQKLEAKLKEALPVASCEGWDFEAHPVDGAKVHALPEP